jgi:putative heme transporter
LTIDQLPPEMPGRSHPRWPAVLAAVVAIGVVVLLAVLARSTLKASAAIFTDLDWPWLPVAVVAEGSSMAAFARTQRRLLRVGGTDIALGSIMALTYAGNAISVSLPLAGSGLSAAFSFRQLSRRGIDPAVAGWALAVSGIISSFAFALVVAAGAVSSGNTTAVVLGLTGAVASVLPMLAVLAALRYRPIRRLLNRLFGRVLAVAHRLARRPGPQAAGALERFLDQIAGLRLPRRQLAEVFALAVWNWVADCLCLAGAIRATGGAVPWHGLFLAYGVAMAAGSIGLTPGGLGVIEVALSAALVAAGLTGHRALAAVLLYRLISFWLVVAAGWVVMAVLGHSRGEPKEPTPQNA